LQKDAKLQGEQVLLQFCNCAGPSPLGVAGSGSNNLQFLPPTQNE